MLEKRRGLINFIFCRFVDTSTVTSVVGRCGNRNEIRYFHKSGDLSNYYTKKQQSFTADTVISNAEVMK